VLPVFVVLSLAPVADATPEELEPLPTPPRTSAPPWQAPRTEGGGVADEGVPSHPTKLRKSGEANQCLLVQGGLGGEPATQFDCDTFLDQYWYFDGPYDYGDGIFWWQLRNVSSGKCLESKDAVGAEPVVQDECDNRSLSQYWRMSGDSSVPSRIMNLGDAMCIAVLAPDPGRAANRIQCESRVADMLFTRADHY
jgi:hypothetical protein